MTAEMGIRTTVSEGSTDCLQDRLYVKAVDERLAGLLGEASPRKSSEDLFSEMRGAFPALVLERLKNAGRDKLLISRSASQTSHRTDYRPELHPLDFEWYFTRESADCLTDVICRRGRTAICLGAPTVAAEAIRRGTDVVLVDRNPLAVQRFPALLRSSQLCLMDVAESERHLTAADAVVFDAPWCTTDICTWLMVAVGAVKRNGLIVFALFPDLVRPTAKTERETVLEVARSIGKVEVLDDAITYETPTFECEALKAIGVSDPGNWRRADLVVIHKHRTDPMPMRQRTVPREAWLTYLVGARVIKVRKSRKSQELDEMVLREVPGTVGFVYSSVSARDPLRDSIDVWTSRNKVARIGNREPLIAILMELERGTDLRVAIGKQDPVLASSRRDELENQLAELLR